MRIRHSMCSARTSLASCLALLAILASSPGAFAQSLPVTGTHTESSPANGRLQSIGDFDDDGLDDYHVFLTRDVPPAAEEVRSVVYSSATGNALRTYANWQFVAFDNPFLTIYPFALPFALGDIDGDGDDEFAEMSVFQTSTPAGTVFTTTVEIFENVASPPMMTLTWPGLSFRGDRIAPIGDLNGDGTIDFVVSGYAEAGPTLMDPYEAYVEFLSGATGSHLHGGLNGSLGLSSSATLGDVNGDGVEDYVLASTDVSNFADLQGGARIYSGATHAPLQTFLGDAAFQFFGEKVLAVDDIDGDSIKDVVFLSGTVAQLPTPNSRISAYSSATGGLLWTVAPPVGSFISMDCAGDINGDGRDDILVNGLALSAGGFVYSTDDGSVIQTLPFGYRAIASDPGMSTNAQCAAGDTNGDGIGEIATIEPLTTTTIGSATGPTYVGTTEVTFTQSRGGEVYGSATPGSTLAMAWIPSPAEPTTGTIEVSGALPNAALFIAVSTMPWNGATFGAGHPLWVSPLPQDLIITTTTMADANGEFHYFETLARPPIAGISLYYQAAQTTAPDAVSNAMQLHFGD